MTGPDVAAAEERVQAAVVAIGEGRPVVVSDDVDRENEGDLVFAAQYATPELLAFTVRHTSGFVCVALPISGCERLALPPMARDNQDRFSTAYRVTVDAVGTGTGISARDRALTILRLGTPSAEAADFVRPGHVVPLAACPGGVLERRGHTEAAVDLAEMAGCSPAGALCELVSRERPGAMARGAELERFAADHGLAHLTIADLVAARRAASAAVRRATATQLPTRHGGFHAVGYAGTVDGSEHVALTMGRLDDQVPVYVHIECISGDVLRSTECGCGSRLDQALSAIARAGRGVVIYLRPAGVLRACAFPGPSWPDHLPLHVPGILRDLGVRSVLAPAGADDPGWLPTSESGTTQPTGRFGPSMWARTPEPSAASQPFLSA